MKFSSNSQKKVKILSMKYIDAKAIYNKYMNKFFCYLNYHFYL